MAKTEGTSILYYTHDTIIMFPSSTCELNYTFVQEPEEQKNGIHMYRTHAGESTFHSPLACSSHCHCKVCAVYTDSAATHARRASRVRTLCTVDFSHIKVSRLCFLLCYTFAQESEEQQNWSISISYTWACPVLQCHCDTCFLVEMCAPEHIFLGISVPLTDITRVRRKYQ